MFQAGAGSTRIDIRSVWFMLLYSSPELLDTLTTRERETLLSGERDNDLLDALAEILARQVESRVRSMLASGYRIRAEPLTRVRGRIDHLATARRRLMDSGRVQCRYQEQTIDLPRYRYMLVTLRLASHRARAAPVRRRCLTTAQLLERCGVSPVDPTAPEMSKEQYGHFDSEDRKLVLLSRLTRDMCAPEHAAGKNDLPAIARNEHALRRLFEESVRGFYRLHLGPLGYSVCGERRQWPAEGSSSGIAHLPNLNVDVAVRGHGLQVVVECKFGPIFDVRYGKTMIKPDYVRQLYSYASIFSREFDGRTEAVLLGALVDGSPGPNLDVVVDGIPVRVHQVDLATPPAEVRESLRSALSQVTASDLA
ncbi:hypothetical protein ACF3NT_12475 [Naumannella halotolerans]|uniref:5-methylcytosine-specific restriction enzyme subunit McrC n=1 Tax=Naumannella halotolerans TaxID=993414 RepID=A0A4V3EMT1_9ACTN|nr:hypothetical protein [Naumannella halotolerans]TDT31048.1 5-methylcytosine-specific restriction enzyme subunit McrC [Naumannella halotolerans]